MRELEFTVRGLPIAQGSPKAFVANGRAIIASEASRSTHGKSTSPLAAWRHAIATEARTAIGDAATWLCPVTVHVKFVFPRPASHYLPVNARRATRELRLDAPRFVTKAPDLDKLVRALGDALTNVVIRDDAQIAGLMAWKEFESDELRPGAVVRIVALKETR